MLQGDEKKFYVKHLKKSGGIIICIHRIVYCFTCGKTLNGLSEILYYKHKCDLSNRPILHSFSSNFKPVYWKYTESQM